MDTELSCKLQYMNPLQGLVEEDDGDDGDGEAVAAVVIEQPQHNVVKSDLE